MERRKLIELLGEAPGHAPRHREPCPDEKKIALYMDGDLQELELETMIRHIVDCNHCIDVIASMARARSQDLSEPDDLTMAKAYRMSEANSNQTGVKKTSNFPRWAAAAVMVLAIGALAERFTNDTTPAVTAVTESASLNTERYAKPLAKIPRILTPVEESVVNPANFTFNWLEVTGSLYYDIRIVSDDGDLVTIERVWGTQWNLPTDIGLQDGEEYFVRVDAFISDGQPLSSKHIVFKVDSRQ